MLDTGQEINLFSTGHNMGRQGNRGAMVFPWDFSDDFSIDQSRSIKGDLRNMFNVVGTFVLRAEDF